MPRKAFATLVAVDIALIMALMLLVVFNVVPEGPWSAAVFPVLLVSNVLFIRSQSRRKRGRGADEQAALDRKQGETQGGRVSARPLTIALILGWVLVVGCTLGTLLWAVRFVLGPSVLSGAECGVGALLAALGWYVMLQRSRRAGEQS